LNRAYDAFHEALDRALDAAGALVPAAAGPETPATAAAEPLAPALAKEASTRLREAAELGDVSGLAAICSELSVLSEAFVPYAVRVARLAEDFDFDGILKLVDELNN